MWVAGAELGLAQVGALTSRLDGDRQTDPIVLRRAVSGSPRLWEWHRAARHGKEARRDVVVELCDETGERVVARWVLVGATPVRWTAAALDANAHDVAMEEIELTIERLEWSSEE